MILIRREGGGEISHSKEEAIKFVLEIEVMEVFLK